ncbi:MAG: GNAT family N-acetyltransferase [Gemmatimonadaceae bacterium]|nr:GNAT family N-acetyltransferase [Gemmatimonadaceae bacterium]
METIRVTRSYVQLLSPGALRKAPLAHGYQIVRADPCPISFARYLYTEVGRDYRWMERTTWADEQFAAVLARPTISVWVLYGHGVPGGFFELSEHDDDSVEITYFGLMRDFIGRGLGKQLLSFAADTAWAMKPSRVWLHTCTLDSPVALPNYLARGFVKYREEEYEVPA